MRKFRIGFYRIQKTYYEEEIKANSFENAKIKFLKKWGKRFGGGKKEIEIEVIKELK